MVTEEEKKKLLQKNSNGNQNGGGRPTCERGEKTKQNKRNEAKRFFLRISRHWSTSSNFTVELIFKDFIKETSMIRISKPIKMRKNPILP